MAELVDFRAFKRRHFHRDLFRVSALLTVPLVSAFPSPRRLRHALGVSVLTLTLFGSPAWAQSDGEGLKLGEQPSPTLDLGASPEKPATDAAPASSESDAGAGTPPNQSSNQTQSRAASGPPEITPHGDWEVACAPGGENCIMTQEGQDDGGNPALRIMIERLAEPQEVEDQTVVAVVDIVTPLGVVLNVGLALTVDKGTTSRAPFQICTVEGCLVREPVTEDVINRFRRGSTTEIEFVVANYGDVKADISLKGFTAAYKSLE